MPPVEFHELAAQLGITTRTLLYYEDEGLVSPERDGRQRVYDRAQVERCKHITEMRKVGIPVSAVRRIFQDRVDEMSVLQARAEAIIEERATLEQQAMRLQRMLHARFAEADAA